MFRNDLALKGLALALKSVLVGSETFKFSLGSLGLIEDHLDSLKTIFLVVELSTNHIVQVLTVLSRLIT